MEKQKTKTGLKPHIDSFLSNFIADRGGIMSVFNGMTVVG
jgi:hypothetical protein